MALPPHFLEATDSQPVTIYYCKAGVQSGQTVRIEQAGQRYTCAGVILRQVCASMVHDNSRGKAKASGARCVLHVTSGWILPIRWQGHGDESDPIELETAEANELLRRLLIFDECQGEENRYFTDLNDRHFFCKGS
jgi:hypothetical protein